MIQMYSGIIRGRVLMVNGELYAQRLRKLISSALIYRLLNADELTVVDMS